MDKVTAAAAAAAEEEEEEEDKAGQEETVSVVVAEQDGGLEAEVATGEKADISEVTTLEKDPDAAAENVAAFIDLTNVLDAETVLQVAGSKLTENYSLFEQTLHRGRQTLAAGSEAGLLDAVLNEVSTLLADLRQLLDGCLKPVRSRKSNYSVKRQPFSTVVLDETLALALGLQGGTWGPKKDDEVDYYSPAVRPHELFPGRDFEEDEEELVVVTKKEKKKKPPGKTRGKKAKPAKKTKKKDTEKEEKAAAGGETGSGEQDGVKKEVTAKTKRKRKRKVRSSVEGYDEGNDGDEKAGGGENKEPKAKVKKEDKQEDGGGESDNYLCLKCGQTLCRAYGKQHEAKCDGTFIRHPEYKKTEDGELVCTIDGCDVGHTFTSIYGLRMHFHATHVREEEKYFACDYCGERFSFNTQRNKHVRTQHLRSHVCDICGRAFGLKDKMETHRFTHTGEKPYPCPKCDYKAAKKYNLEMHLQAKHNEFGQKEFLCAICNKQFVTMGRVRRHMATIHADGRAASTNKRRNKILPLPPHLKLADQEVLQAKQEQQGVEVPAEEAGHQIVHVLEEGQTVQFVQEGEGGEGETLAVVGVTEGDTAAMSQPSQETILAVMPL